MLKVEVEDICVKISNDKSKAVITYWRKIMGGSWIVYPNGFSGAGKDYQPTPIVEKLVANAILINDSL